MASRILNLKEQVETSLHDPTKPWTKLFDTIEAKTGINRLYIFVGVITIIGLWLVFGYAGQLVCNLISFLYPAYMSIHAIESPAKDDDTKWLTYWVVFAVFSLLEFFADIIVGWFPVYWLTKCIFFIWLMLPGDFNGSIILYKRIVKPFFLKHHGSVDSIVNKAAKTFEKDD